MFIIHSLWTAQIYDGVFSEAGSPDIGLSAPDNPPRHIIDVDSEVAFCFQRPVVQTPFDSPPSRQTQRNVDSLIELIANVIENSQIPCKVEGASQS